MDNHFYVNPRYKDHNGIILDIGCFSWDWSAQFANQKTVVGVDTLEKSCPAWATLIPKAVGIADGTTTFTIDQGSTSILFSPSSNKQTIDVIGMSTLLQMYPSISVLKMNVEGCEYPLLMSMKHPAADQLIVSFHDTEWLSSSFYSPKATEAMLSYLSNWYDFECICKGCKWFLGLKK